MLVEKADTSGNIKIMLNQTAGPITSMSFKEL